MSLHSQAAKGMRWASVSTVVTASLQVAQYAILARFLEPNDFGLMAMVSTVVGFAQVFGDMGLTNAIIHRQNVSAHELSSLYWANLLAGVIVCVLVWVSAPLVVLFYHEPDLSQLLLWAGIIFLIAPIGQQFQSILQKELQFNLLAKVETFSIAAGTAVSIASALMEHGVYALIWGQLVATLFRALYLVSVGWRGARPMFHFQFEEVRGFLSFGAYQMGSRSINYLNSRCDQLLVGVFAGAQALGYYNLAFNIVALPVSKINPIVTRVAFPIFAKIQDELERLKRGYVTCVRLLCVINFPILLGLAAVAPTAIPVLFGENWQPTVGLVQVLAVVYALRSFGNPVGALVLAKGRADMEFRLELLVLFTQVPGVYLGARLAGGLGVAVTLLALQVLYSVYSYLFLIRPLLGKCLQDYVKSILPTLGVAVSMGVIVGIFDRSLFGYSDIVRLALDVGVGAAAYILPIIWLMRTEVRQIWQSAFDGRVMRRTR